MSSHAWLPFTGWTWVAMALGALGIGLNKGGLTGLSILIVVLFASLLPPRDSTGLVLPLLMIGDLFGTTVYRKVVRWDIFLLMIPPMLVGVITGFFLMSRISEASFGPFIGWIVMALVLLQITRTHFGKQIDPIFKSRSFGIGMGALAGFTTMVANAAGPVANLYFLSVRLQKLNLIGTTAWVFFCVNIFKLPFSIFQGLVNLFSLHLTLTLAPFVLMGCFLGRHIARIMPERIFELFLLVCTILGAVRLILS